MLMPHVHRVFTHHNRLFHAVKQVHGHGHGIAVLFDGVQDNGKFIAAQSGHGAILANLSDAVSRGLQNLVAHRVPRASLMPLKLSTSRHSNARGASGYGTVQCRGQCSRR